MEIRTPHPAQVANGTPMPRGPSAIRLGAEIRVSHVTHRYRHAKNNVLEDVDLHVSPGEAVALIGRSGCGKSTLLQIIAGLLTPSTGEVRIDGEAVRRPSPRWVMMFQQPSLFPWASVVENVALGLRFNGRTLEAKTRIPELLDLVELGAYANCNVQDLSGGQQQRVALARSLALSPDALLLDEPFSALDAFARGTLQRDVRRLARSFGLTLIIVTHDINEAATMADRAFIMTANPGRIGAQVTIRSPETSTGREGFEQARSALTSAYENATGLLISAPGDDWCI